MDSLNMLVKNERLQVSPRSRAQERYKISIEPVEADVSGLCELACELSPPFDIGDEKYLNWQYFNNPAGTVIGANGRIGEQLVGHYAVYPLNMQIGGKPIKGSLSANTMTHEDHRGKGIFMVLADEAYALCKEQDVALTIGFPNPQSYKGFVKHLAFQDIGELPLWLLPLDLVALSEAVSVSAIRMIKPLLPLGTAAIRGLCKISSLIWQGDSQNICERFEFDNSFDRLWENSRSGYQNAIERSSSYLQWRFVSHPTRKYRIFTYESKDELIGYIVIRNSAIKNIPSGLIVDFNFEHSKRGQAACSSLVARAVREFIKEGVALVGSLANSNSIATSGLRRNGFSPCPKSLLPQPFPVIVRTHNCSPELQQDALDISKWYLTMGDYDAV